MVCYGCFSGGGGAGEADYEGGRMRHVGDGGGEVVVGYIGSRGWVEMDESWVGRVR